ncbi:MAG: heavy-metal-associated domain-containing protein [Elusimicrobia bacterium]|nr:heavy-metal-associated domain-containing protein [Elusimicrobiota bacterium]
MHTIMHSVMRGLVAAAVVLASTAPLIGAQETRMKAGEAQIQLVCTAGGCPGGQGFCCTSDRKRVEKALKGVKGVTRVIPDAKTRTFTVVYAKRQVMLSDLQKAAQRAGFEVSERQAQ